MAVDDYRRVVLLVAALAVGFFVPSLLIAGVPIESWLGFTVAALLAGFVIATSFVLAPRGSSAAVVVAVTNALVVACLGLLYRDYYHQIPLLFSLLVAAHAIIHGLRAALVAVALGGVLVPLVIGASSFNGTDPVYAAIYLFGVALIPWVAGRLASRRSVALGQQLDATLATEREAVLILARASEAKDEVTGDHVARVGHLSADLAERAGLAAPEVEDIRYAAMLHDVGKLHVSDRILTKPGRLTLAEIEIMREHTIWGERILGSTAGFESARIIARSHHENWNGTGYPDGLAGEDIPLFARIVHLADAFDALMCARAYKPAWPLERCLEELEAQSGRMFDPELVAIFLPLAESLPVRFEPAEDHGGLRLPVSA